jgi:chemotaxis methyl-accepting protein methylase
MAWELASGRERSLNAISPSITRVPRLRHVIFKSRPRQPAINFAPLPNGPPCTAAALRSSKSQVRLSADEKALVDRLFAASGLDAGAYRIDTLRRRLPACLRAIRAESIADALARVRADRSLVVPALNALMIGVTSFFRDEAVFEFLAQVLLPGLQQTSEGPRIWSAGCSSGEELVSLAILLAERGQLHRSTLLGTDCRSASIAAARNALFSSRAVGGVPQAMLDRYFVPEPAGWRLNASLAEAIQWRTGDLTRGAEPGPWDLITCRNVVMYLAAEPAARIWRQLESALRPGGYLVLGRAERPGGAARLENIAPCIYRRV